MIQLRDIKKTYKLNDGEFNALDVVSLDIEDGEMLAVMGASGSGKSTLLNIIGGMDKPTDGEYKYNDIVVSDMGNTKLHNFRRDTVSFVFQQFALMNRYTIYENVEMPLIAKHISKSKRKEIVREKLQIMNIAEQAKKYPTQLSGGQQQRAAIARALAADNKLILADEPTGALDSNTGNDIMNIFTEINKSGKTVIIITHDEKVAKCCQRVINLSDGKIV